VFAQSFAIEISQESDISIGGCIPSGCLIERGGERGALQYSA